MAMSAECRERNVRGRPVARCARVARALAVAMAAAILGASAFAQVSTDKYPEKPIKIIVPFAPGGSVDILARVIAQKLTENWRQPVIVETRPGASAMIGTHAAAKADPDRYTLIIVVSTHVTQALPQSQSGLGRALGVTAAARYASIPNVPTFREQGFDLVASEWYGLLAPAGTAKPIVAKLNAEMRRIMALPNLGERLAAIELLSSSPEELSDFIRGEIDRWSPVIKKLGLKAE